MESRTTEATTTILDVRGQSCPMPIVRLSQAIKSLSSGDLIEVLSTDRGSWSDVPSWALTTGHHLIERSEEDAVFRYLLRKA